MMKATTKTAESSLDVEQERMAALCLFFSHAGHVLVAALDLTVKVDHTLVPPVAEDWCEPKSVKKDEPLTIQVSGKSGPNKGINSSLISQATLRAS
jgi:hypothetical protein